MARKQKKSTRETLIQALSSWGFLIIGIGLLLALGYAVSRQAWKNYQITQEIAQLEKDITSLEKRNSDLGGLITYLGSPQYQELAAKERLGLKKDGEKVIGLPDINVADDVAEEQVSGGGAIDSSDTRSNSQKWWDYFFGKTL